MKVIIAGGRDYNDFKSFRDNINLILNSLCHDEEPIEIVSGHCPTGVDKLCESYATFYGFKIRLFPADWNKHGKAAGPIRNKEMAKYADALIAFWDGQSRGTKSMIELAETEGLKVKIVKY